MSKPQVLIVGCGAVGLTAGFFLSKGASITYLVRPGRKSAFVPPKNLYSYQHDALHQFSDYRVVETASEVSGETFFCVFDTLDGHTAKSEGGTKTLASVGNLINEPQNKDCFVLYDAIGLDIDEHYSSTMRFPKDRFIFAASLFAHQPTPSISIPSTANQDLTSKADMFYIAQPGNVGLIIMNSNTKLVKAFRDLYEQNGGLQIQTIPTFAQPMLNLAMLHLVTWNVDGWNDFDHLVQNTELWSIMLKAQTEVLTLPRFGWTGWLLSWVFGSWMTTKLNKAPIDGALPMPYREFNAFHHGGKVVKQDIQTLEELLADGKKSAHRMPALEEIIARAAKTEEGKARTGLVNNVSEDVRKRR